MSEGRFGFRVLLSRICIFVVEDDDVGAITLNFVVDVLVFNAKQCINY